MAAIELRLLGGFDLCVGGVDVQLPGQKDRALLTYLAMTAGTEHRRERLAGMLWGETDEARARDSLKHALSRLRAALGDAAGALATSRNAVGLGAGALWLDAVEFAAEAETGDPVGLGRALTLWRGALLDGVAPDEPGFDDWLAAERQRLAILAELAAGRIVAHFADHGTPDEAAAAAARALAVDPLNERACRLLMRARADAGDTPAAMKAFRDFSARLGRELGIAPEPETAVLARDIREGRSRRSPAGTTAAEPIDPPSRPTVAVMPFKSLTGQGEYFADGIAEEIATALSRNRGLVLISRGSSFALRDRAMDARAIGAALGARYLVGGSLARDGDRVRLNVTLTDAMAGTEVWSEAFQDLVSDIFELQDRIAAQVVGTLLPRMEQAEIARAVHKPTDDPDAYDFYLRGLAEMHKWVEQSSGRALDHFSRATELDPGFATAHAMKVRCYSQRKASGWMKDPDAETEEARRLSRLAADLAPDDALVLAIAGLGLGYVGGHPEQGVRLTGRALQLNPNLAWGWVFSGWLHVWLGNSETAIEQFERAMRLSPQDPQLMMMQAGMGWAHFTAGRTIAAAEWAEAAVLSNPNVKIAWCALAASRGASGDHAGAQEAKSEVLRLDPEFSVSNLMTAYPIRGEANQRVWTDALRRAGLPG